MKLPPDDSFDDEIKRRLKDLKRPDLPTPPSSPPKKPNKPRKKKKPPKLEPGTPPPSPPSPPRSPKKEPKKEPKREPKYERQRGSDGRSGSNVMQSRSAPTQQVTVPTTIHSATTGLGAISSKIDQLLRSTKEARVKKKQKSAFAGAKKQYRDFRKRAMANLKNENKEIRKREIDKIKRLPVKQRAAAKKKLKEALKARLDKLKRDFPSKVSTPGELRNLMSKMKTVKV